MTPSNLTRVGDEDEIIARLNESLLYLNCTGRPTIPGKFPDSYFKIGRAGVILWRFCPIKFLTNSFNAYRSWIYFKQMEVVSKSLLILWISRELENNFVNSLNTAANFKTTVNKQTFEQKSFVERFTGQVKRYFELFRWCSIPYEL